VGVLANAGGLGILCADACAAAGLSLPELSGETRAPLAQLLPAEASLANPVDLLGSAAPETYQRAIPLILEDPAVDALVVLFVPPVIAGAEEVAAAIRRAVGSRPQTKPVIAVVISADGIPASLRDEASGVVALPYPESPARALRVACDRAEWLRQPAGVVPDLAGIDAAAARRLVEGELDGADDLWLGPESTRRLLEAYGVPLVPQRDAADVEEAVAAARELGFPVVVKTAAAGAHKTEHGGVALDLRDDDQVRSAVARIGAPVIVQPLVPGGVKLLAGVVQDPVFGPLVAFGPGGVLPELIGEAGFCVVPLTDLDAEELVLSGKAGRLVRGFRGAPPADSAALADLVQRLAKLGEDIPEIAELDLNPVMGMPSGCIVVDARIRLHRPPGIYRLKSW
jgi:acyl-CoA synthetase (NDP forming)